MFSIILSRNIMPEHLFFFLGLGFILTHEMDAIRCKEWLMFPATFFLKDETGFLVFTLAHIPLYAWVCWSLSSSSFSPTFIRAWDVFLIVHVFLHILFLKHPENRFTTRFSWFIILGAGICGALDFLFSFLN